MTESEHLNIQQVRRETKFWALFAKYYDIFKKANNVDELKRLYQKLKSQLTNSTAKAAADFFYRVRRDVILGYIDLQEINQFLEENKMINEFSAKAHGKKAQTWTFKSSSNPNKKYETVKWQDGSYSCNCPGWTRRINSNKERLCKHVKQVGGKPYKDVPTVEEMARKIIQKILQEMNEGSLDKFYNTTVQHNKDKTLVGDVVRFDGGKLLVKITKGKYKDKLFHAYPSEVKIVK